jgi:hypothetical protein
VRQPGAAPSIHSIKAFKASKGNMRTAAHAESLLFCANILDMPAAADSRLAELTLGVLQPLTACRKPRECLMLAPASTAALAGTRERAAKSLSCHLLYFLQCPLPTGPRSGGGSGRGTLGAKKHYGGGAATAAILAAIGRKVYVDGGSSSSLAELSSINTAAELVLYDPEEHRMQLQNLHDAQQQAQQQADKQQRKGSATQAAAVEVTSSSSPGAAGETTDAEPGDTAVVAAPQSDSAQQQLPSAGDAEEGATEASKPAAPNIAFGINWDQRVKVYADMFLVEKLRPHQREGVK